MADRLDSEQRLLLQIAQSTEAAVAGSSGINAPTAAALALKEDKANKDTDGTLSANSDIRYPSQKATKTYADTKQAALGFTPENVANKDTDSTLAANSDTKYPSQKATKTYADGILTQAQAYTDELTINHSTLTYNANTVIDFTGDPVKTETLTGDVAFTSTNRSAGRSISVRLIASGGARALSVSASWTPVGAVIAASLASGKTAILTVTAFGSAETDVVYAYAAQP